jgi:hypothetical protein
MLHEGENHLRTREMLQISTHIKEIIAMQVLELLIWN